MGERRIVRYSGTTCRTVSGWPGRAGSVREHPVDRRLQRWQVAAEAGVEAVPDLAGGGAVLYRGRVGDLGRPGGSGSAVGIGRSCATPARQITATARMPAAASPPLARAPRDGHRQRHDPGEDGEAGQFQRVRAGGRIAGQRAGQRAELIRRISHGQQPDARSGGQVGLPGAKEQHQGAEHSGQRMRRIACRSRSRPLRRRSPAAPRLPAP